MANITAGHLLIILVSGFLTGGLLLIILELVVRLIQAFVFTLLLTLYFNESN
jgi:F0F1-type ATP synthase membrane subunit a